MSRRWNLAVGISTLWLATMGNFHGDVVGRLVSMPVALMAAVLIATAVFPKGGSR